MATITASYSVKISGYQGKVILPDGSEATTKLFCQGDKRFLEDTLEAMKRAGDVKSYEVIWTEIEGQAGEV